MHAQVVDYRAQQEQECGQAPRWPLINRGFWLHSVPRLMAVCRLVGHRPVVAGTDPTPLAHSSYRGPGHRWVCCDRCGVRPDPQGSLDPGRWAIGQPYTFPLDSYQWPVDEEARFQALKSLKDQHYPPGAWPANPTGTLGGQLVVGRREARFGVNLKVGNAGSEHTLAAHVVAYPLGALYLHTERFGQGVQRWLNPTGYQSRVISLDVHNGRLYWSLWAKRDEHSSTDPKWMHGSVRIDPRDILLGEWRYRYVDESMPVTVTVRLPHGDDHEVRLQLQRRLRERRRTSRWLGWTVDWESRPGIPTKPHGGEVLGSGVDVSAAAVKDGSWPQEAAAAIAAQITAWRTRYGYRTESAS